MRVRAAILTISTSRAAGDGADESGDATRELRRRTGCEIAGREVIPDDPELISARLVHWSDADRCDLVLTTGGTALARRPDPRGDAVGDRAGGAGHPRGDARGIAAAYPSLDALARGRRHPRRTLIVNFPGSPKSIEEAGEAIAAALPSAARAARREAKPALTRNGSRRGLAEGAQALAS